MPPTLPPLTAADFVTIVPPEPDIVVSPWHSWIPTPDAWNHAPTFLLPPAKPAPAPPALPLADFPLRRCAQIAATLAL